METKEIKLTDVCDFQGGTQPPKEEWIDEQKEGYVRMLQIRDFTQGKAEHIAFVKDTKKLNKCKIDDILIGRYGASVGKILTGLEGAYNVAIMKTIPDETKLLKKYLYYVLTGVSFQNFISRIGARAAQAGFNKDDLTYFKLHLPSLENQGRIANILSKAEELVKQREEGIDLLDDLLKFHFLKLFGDPIQNSKNWEIKRLDKISKLERGRFSPRPRNDPSFFNGVFPFIQTGDISKSEHRLKSYSQTLNEKGIKVSKEFKKGTIVIAIVGATIGATAILEIDVYATDSIIGIKPNNLLTNNYFLEMVLRFWKPVLLKNAPQAARANINLEILNKLEVITPPIDLQNQYAKTVKKAEDIKLEYERSKKELEKLFISLGQKAIKGDLNIIEKIEITETIKIQPKISAEVVVIDKISKELADFHESIPHSEAPDEIDNTLRQLDAELKIRGEIPFTENYVKYRLIKEKQTGPFTFEKLWKDITEFPFESLPDYDEFSELLFGWLGEGNSFIKQQYNEITKQTELVLNETATA